jgi:hypothetical protein
LLPAAKRLSVFCCAIATDTTAIIIIRQLRTGVLNIVILQTVYLESSLPNAARWSKGQTLVEFPAASTRAWPGWRAFIVAGMPWVHRAGAERTESFRCVLA